MLIAYAGSDRRGFDADLKPSRCGNHRGRKPGSKTPVFTADDDETIIRLYSDGAPYEVIGNEIGQPRTNVFKRCQHLELPLRVGR